MNSTMLNRQNPFPGKGKPYTERQGKFFFGREEEIDGLKAKIRKEHFVCLVGHSNVGKTSLVQGGLKPKLRKKFSAKAGADWLIVELDADKPLYDSLSEKLTSQKKGGLIEKGARIVPKFKSDRRKILGDKKGKGLIQIYKRSAYLRRHNILFIIDHFEKVHQSINERDTFVQTIKLLYNAVQDKDTAIYVLLVMHKETLDDIKKDEGERYKFLRTLVKFPYPLHRISESGLKQAITQPPAQLNIQVTEDVCNKLVNKLAVEKVGSQLPSLQEQLTAIWLKLGVDESIITLKHIGERTVSNVKKKEKPTKLKFEQPKKEQPVVKEIVEPQVQVSKQSVFGKIRSLQEIAIELYGGLGNEAQKISQALFMTLLERKGGKLELLNIKIELVSDMMRALDFTEKTREEISKVVERYVQKRIVRQEGTMICLNKDFPHEKWEIINQWMTQKDGLLYSYLLEDVRDKNSVLHTSEVKKKEKETWWRMNKNWLTDHSSPAAIDEIEYFFKQPIPKNEPAAKPKRKIKIKGRR